MSHEIDQELIESNLRSLASSEFVNGLQKNINNKIDLYLPGNLLKIIEIFHDFGEYELSLKCSERLVNVAPESPSGFQRLIQDYLNLDRLTDASNVASLAVKQFPDDPGILMLTCNIFRATAQPQEALQYSSHLLSKHPDLPAGYYCSAQCLVDLGRISEAKKLIKTLIASIDTPLSNILARDFYREIGMRQRAKKISSQIAQSSPSIETNIQFAIDLLVLGRTQRFFRFIKKKNLINGETDIKFFHDLLSREFAMNLASPLDNSWRSLSVKYKVFEHFKDTTFNKYPFEMRQDNSQLPWICVIHVGKCAGESIVRSLKCMLPELKKRIVEYHVFDSNILINQLLSFAQYEPNIDIIFCTRDPLERWVSSFNWDFYTYKLRKHYYCPRYILNLFDKYDSSKKLARGIYNCEEEAFTLAKAKHLSFGHMAMGQSWYLPMTLMESIKPSQFHLIRTNSIKQDLSSCFKKLSNKYGILAGKSWNIDIPILKNSKSFYVNYSMSVASDLSSHESDAVFDFLSEDVKVHQILVDRFAGH